MTKGVDPIAARRAELARRLAALTPEQRAKLATTMAAEPQGDQRTIPKRDPSAPIPMSYSQELLWRLERASPSHVYNVPRAVRLKGPFDVSAMQRALDALVARHESLHTTFDLVGDEPRQIINPPASVTFEQLDVSHLPEGERETRARQHMVDIARRTFELSRDAMFQAALIKLGPDDHVLVLLTHHVVSDGWSGNIVMRELAAFYDAFKNGTAPALAPLSIQYADYALWQRRMLSGERLQKMLDFWKTELAGAPTILDLPTDYPRPIVPSFQGKTTATTLPLALLEKLRAFTRTQGITSFMVMLAALEALIYRYTGEEEIIIGTPVAGRPYPEIENVVGYFANTLLLRASLGGNPTFRELLERVRQRTLAAYDHQDIPLETLLTTKLENNRPIAANPQVVLSTEDPGRAWLKFSGTTSESFGASLGGAKFELGLWTAEREDGLRIAAEYRSDLYEDDTIERFMQHFGVLLDAALMSPDTRIGDLPLLTSQERELVLRKFNQTDIPVPTGVTVDGVIAERAKTTPDRIAVSFEGATLTDAQLEAASEAFAERLAALGVKPGVIVGLFVERSLEMVVALLGTWKAGGAFMPIDPEYPKDRIEYMLGDANAAVVLTHSHLRDSLPETSATIVDIGDALAPNASHLRAPVTPHDENDTAYLLYTSGSTGKPKGVLVPHHCFVNHEYWFNSIAKLTPDDTVLHRGSLTFDPSICEVFLGLIFGARLIVAPPGGHKDLPLLVDLMIRDKVTIVQSVPSIVRILLETKGIEQCTSVRLLTVGGEAMLPDLVAQVHAKMPQVEFYNLYGPTETTIDATWWHVPKDHIPATIPIGAPVGNGRTYVLFPNGDPTPLNVSGELFIGGAGVTDGYLGRPDLTAQRFVPDPFEGKGRMYKTGDRARWRASGQIEFLGRLDDQVKLRGIRIELGEVEAVLCAQKGVDVAAVAVHPDGAGGERLVGYLVAAEGAELDVSKVRDGAARSLPPAVMPSVLVVLDELPLTASGKVNRRALPAPDVNQMVVSKPFVGPRTVIELELVQIWDKLIGGGRKIGVHDDFFEIGGHSLLAIQMLAEIERVRGFRVPLAWLFESSTIESLANHVAEVQLGVAEPPLIIMQQDGTETPIAFVHGDWTGGGWYARRLAPLAAPNAPFYLLPTTRPGDAVQPLTIEQMAARHIEELKKVRPSGAWRVVGFCVGGVVAFEVARQLREAGDQVERVVTIDSKAINSHLTGYRSLASLVSGANDEAGVERQAQLMRRIRWLLNRVAKAKQLPIATGAAWIVRASMRRAARLLGASRASAKPGAPMKRSAIIEDGVVTERLLARAAAAYVPRHYAGAIDIIWATGTPVSPRPPAPVEAWGQFVDEVRLKTVGGTHLGLVTNDLPAFGAALKEVLDLP